MIMADPTNEKAIQEIEKTTKLKVQTFVSTTTEIISYIEKEYKIILDNKKSPGKKVSEVSFHSAAEKKKGKPNTK